MEQNKESNFDLRALWQQLLDRWYWFAISIVVFGVVGFIIAKAHQPVYSVRANIKIESSDNTASLLTRGSGTGPDFTTMFGGSPEVEDEIFVLSSHSLYRDVANQLGVYAVYHKGGPYFADLLLYQNEPVRVSASPEMLDTLSYSIIINLDVDKKGIAEGDAYIRKVGTTDIEPSQFPIEVNTGVGPIRLEKTKDFPEGKSFSTKIMLQGTHLAAERLQNEIMVDRNSKKSSVVNMAIETENRDYGRAVLNEVVALYNRNDVEQKSLQGAVTQKFLESRLKLLEKEISDGNDLILEYQEKYHLADVGAESALQYSARSEAEKNLIGQEWNLELQKMTLDYLKSLEGETTPTLLPISLPGIPSDAIKSYNDLVLGYLDISRSATDDNLMVKRQLNRIENTRHVMLTSFERGYQTQQATIQESKKQMNTRLGNIDELPVHSRFYQDAYRELQVKNGLYSFLLQRLEETQMLASNATPKGTIIDESYVISKPVSMSRKVIFLIFLAIGFMLPLIVMYVQKLLRNKFSTREEVEQYVNVPVLGEMVTDNSGRTMVVGKSDTSSSAELMRMIRANLQFVLNDANDRVVLVTSTIAGEGKSFISVNLAASLSLLGKKTLLVGMDIRSPQLANYLKLNAPFGLTQYLSDQSVSLDQIILDVPGMPDLQVITAGPVPPNPGELLMSNKVDELFAQLRQMYDYIIVDSAPVGMVSDTFNLSRISDATVYVCRANKTTLHDLRFIDKINRDRRLKKMALVVNGTTTRRGYGYGYGNNTKKK